MRKGVALTGRQILDRIFQEHCDTVDLIWGLELKAKTLFRSKSISFSSLTISALKILLKYAFGREITGDEYDAYLRKYDRSNVKKIKIDSLNFFGYVASKGAVITWASLIAFYWWYHFNDDSYLSSIATHETVFVVHSILALFFIDTVAPSLILHFMNILVSINIWLVFKPVSIVFRRRFHHGN